MLLNTQFSPLNHPHWLGISPGWLHLCWHITSPSSSGSLRCADPLRPKPQTRMFVLWGSFFTLWLFPHCEAVSCKILLSVYVSAEFLLLSYLQSSEKQLTSFSGEVSVETGMGLSQDHRPPYLILRHCLIWAGPFFLTPWFFTTFCTDQVCQVNRPECKIGRRVSLENKLLTWKRPRKQMSGVWKKEQLTVNKRDSCIQSDNSYQKWQSWRK